ncbi:MAG: RAMP superfamily protein [Candidatus Scalindua brodae]|uniref:RAMP superfamily protein n=1 Tax=Candidatus Scalindua brodae TaxID=237368 RepID=A0A0B0EPC6_9BACT|nr:MAG: RAMP superfamily protein [Candidatus Scalindua brodae]
MPLIKEQGRKPEGIIRTGICIDRDTETASNTALFSHEVVEEGTQFQFELIAENLEGDDFGILSLGLQELINGNVYIGARSSVGLGKCRLNRDISIQYFDENFPPHTLKEYLADNIMGTPQLGWINEKIKLYLSGLSTVKG